MTDIGGLLLTLFSESMFRLHSSWKIILSLALMRFCIALLFGSLSHLSPQPVLLILTDHPITVLFFIFLISAPLISLPAPGPDTQS